MMEKKTDVIILIPHYNNLKGLYKSLNSIRENINIDVLVVDDGSIDKPSKEYLEKSFIQINQFHLLLFDSNKGIEYALNEGLHFIKNSKEYKYIGRLDCGDICVKNRFTMQAQFLKDNENIDLVGAWAICTNEYGDEIYQFKHSTSHEIIKRKMYYHNMFVHPAVMFTTRSLEIVGYYPVGYKYAEDYAYFFKFVKKLKTANLPIFLLKYEINYNGSSMSNRKQQAQSRIRIIFSNLTINLSAILGLLYNVSLYFMPLSLLQLIKRQIHTYKN